MSKKCVCAHCEVEAFCAANDWSLYDHRNKKCPNWLEGVKQYHRFLKEEKRDQQIHIDYGYLEDFYGLD